MSKLYVFGIGGTGARVIKSLTYLLASGIKLAGGVDTVVPIIIDPDYGNGDLTRTKRLLDVYIKLNKKVKSEEGFFSTKIKTLPELVNSGTITDKFKMLDMSGTQNEKFRDFIGYSSLPNESKALVELLFSDNNLNAEMSVGFKGNPNIGSVVLNQFKNSPEYQLFLNSFETNDLIFIVSSIFGGTGAAGFPLLLRNLRKPDSDFPGSERVADSRIGALSMMPYFKINDPEDKSQKTIDSSSFMGKAKAALSFYSSSIFGANKQLNAFYTLGEDASNFYDHNDGQQAQKNNAHFLELAASLAIVDFTKSSDDLETRNNKAVQTYFREFGVKELSSRRITFKTLGDQTSEVLLKPLSKLRLMVLFQTFVKENRKDFERSPWFIALKEVYSNGGLYDKYFQEFGSQFTDWIGEMKDNDISFDPFRSDPSYEQLLNFIHGYTIEKSKLKIWTNPLNGNKFNEVVNKELQEQGTTDDKGEDFISLFNRATDRQIDKIIN